MKATANEINLTFTDKDQPLLFILLNMSRKEAVIATEPLKEVVGKGKKLAVDIEQHRNKRSLDANSYCWVLCQKIAEVIESTKEEVYQKVIREEGQWNDFPIVDEAVDTFISRWNRKGLGDFAEIQRPSKIEGYTIIRAYYGSSIYNSKEMSTLINELVIQAQELGIETKPEAEIRSLINTWEGK